MDGHPGLLGGWTEPRLQAGSPSPLPAEHTSVGTILPVLWPLASPAPGLHVTLESQEVILVSDTGSRRRVREYRARLREKGLRPIQIWP